MRISGALRQQFFLWGMILALWCLLVLAFAGHLVFNNEIPWQQALLSSLREWAPWAVLAPVVAWLAHKFPLERRRLALTIPIHVVACMLAVLGCELTARHPAPPLGALPGFPPRFPRGFPPEGRPPFDEETPPPDAQRPPGPGRLTAPGEQDGVTNGAALDNRPPFYDQRPPRRGPPFGPRPGRRPDGPGPQQPFPGSLPGQRAGQLFWNGAVMRAQFNIPIYWVIVSIVQAFRYYRRFEEKERAALELEARLAEAKLDALRMQLHPHFLFNTLNAISTLVHKDPQAADEMIANLSELLRATLDTSEQEIPLRQELEFLDRYLEIQQARFGPRLRIVKEIDAATSEMQVPTLILQPLVENAIRHGIEPQTSPGVVTIRAQRQDDALALTVRDNGPGMKTEGKASGGIGLSNTRARLQQLYGTQGRMVMNTSSEGGCSVELYLPIHAKAQV